MTLPQRILPELSLRTRIRAPMRPRWSAVPIALADEYVLNTGTLEEALDAFGRIVERNRAS